MWWRPSSPKDAREAQKRAVSSMISTPIDAMKASSAVAFQYSHTPQATSAEMWCSMRPLRMGTISPSGPRPYGLGPDGEMVPILSGLMEHHISADVAWGVWEYWKATADDAFMASMGVEIMLETARFWASRSSFGDDGRYHIRLVVGPDEYHEGVDDNAYTNVLARWNIGKAVEALGWLDHVDSGYAEELRHRLDLDDDEIEQWLEVMGNLEDGFDPATKLFEQFAGFYQMTDAH